MDRTRNAMRNIVFAGTLRLYQTIIPFLMRTAMIYFLGVEYLGLNGLFASILQVLNLAELGVGAAMVYSMYKPIVTEDKPMICALLKLYQKYYRIIGLLIATVGLCITPFIPRLIKGDTPADINIYVLYLLNLAATVLTYWLFAYKGSILQANQRNDVVSKVTLLTTTVQYAVQLAVLWAFHDYYLYVLVMLATQALTNIIIAIIANKMYPEYKPSGTIPKSEMRKINRRIRDLFTEKLGTTIVNSADTIVISAFLGLTVLVMYQNYYFIMSAVMTFLSTILYSCLSSVGNSMITDSKEKNYTDFLMITFSINWIITICMCCFITMYHPFITLWVGEKYTFSTSVTILFCVYFYLVIMQQVMGVYKDAAGIWHQDRFRPLLAAVVNLICNLAFVKMWGIYAILGSTVFSYVIVAFPWMIHNVFKYVFQRDWKKYTLDLICYFLIATVIMLLCFGISRLTAGLPLVWQVVFNGVICVVVSNVLLFLIFRKNSSFKPMIRLADKFTKHKFGKLFDKLLAK